MKAVKIYGIKELRLEEVEIPKIEEENQVLIKVMAAGICGSDISRYAKLGAKYKEGLTFGHECSGKVEDVGKGVTKFKKGDRVAVCPALPCFECDYCKKGQYVRCNTLEVIGAPCDGCFAQYLLMPERNLMHLPDEISYEQAAMIEPGTVVLHGLYRMGINPGDNVAVVGCGPIGLLAVNWAKAFGANKIIAIDIMDEKLNWAKEMGATDVINSKDNDMLEEILKLTNNKGVDCAVEAAGTAYTCSNILTLACKGGRILYLGVPYGDVPFSRNAFEKIGRNELTIFGSWNGNEQGFPGKPWEVSLEFLKSGKVNYMPMVTHRYNIDETVKVFEKIYKRDTLFGKILILPNENEE